MPISPLKTMLTLSSNPSSSQLSSRSTNQIRTSPPPLDPEAAQPEYREAKSVPYELCEHCLIYFEERLYIQAIDLITSLLISGYGQLPALVAPPQHLALLGTLTVHPTLTSRAKSLDRVRAGNSSLRYLRLVLQHVGPIRGRLAEAFSFYTPDSASRRGGRRRARDSGDSPVKDSDDGIDNELANDGALWILAEDFWHVIGWGFNCSVLHPRRWEVWQTWLTYMLEVLEADWDLRFASDSEPLEESLIVRYLTFEGAKDLNERRVLRAIFADGSTKSVNEFREVWQNETKELRKDNETKKAEKRIDIEADDYGDYLDEEKDDSFETSSQASSYSNDRSPAKIDANQSFDSSIPNGSELLGGMESISLRTRLLSLLSKVSAIIPGSFIQTTHLYDLYLDNIRPLPLPTFFLMMSPLGLRHFTVGARSTLTQYLLRTIISGSAPEPPSDTLDQCVLEKYYLPFPANSNSIIDNTKVSLCVETLLRLLDTHAGLVWTPELHAATENGIRARRAKAKKVQQRRGADGDGSADSMWLRGSAERIRLVVKMATPEMEEMEFVSSGNAD